MTVYTEIEQYLDQDTVSGTYPKATAIAQISVALLDVAIAFVKQPKTTPGYSQRLSLAQRILTNRNVVAEQMLMLILAQNNAQFWAFFKANNTTVITDAAIKNVVVEFYDVLAGYVGN